MNIESKKILVTGGAGFIGSYIVESLVEKGAYVIVYDNFSTGKKENLSKVINDVKIIEGDILDVKSLEDACKDIDVISHQAAQLEIFKSQSEPLEDLTTNTIGTLNILNAARNQNIPKIINASSACIYGQAENTPQNENHRKNPNWPYGVSKLAAEKYCSIYHHDFHIDITNLRYAIVYGEREWFGRVLTIFLKFALDGKPPVIFGNGEQLRDFVYVKDVVSAHNLCLIQDIKYESFNVSTGIGTSINQLAQYVIELFLPNKKPIYDNVKEGEISSLVKGRRRTSAELNKMVLDSSKITRELGWHPKIKLRDGLVNEMNWLKSNLDRWQLSEEIRV